MGVIRSFYIHNYGTLRDVAVGSVPSQSNKEISCLGNIVAFIGPSGSGKSTIADAFSFVSDCISSDVETALNMKNRGGFDKVITQGSNSFFSIVISYNSDDKQHMSYYLSIGKDTNNKGYVLSETLTLEFLPNKQFTMMQMREGKGGIYEGITVSNGRVSAETSRNIELSDPSKLAIVTFGGLKEYPIIGEYLDFMKSWYLCYFTPDAARCTQTAAPTSYLNSTGNNINNVAQYMYKENPEEFKAVLLDIQKKIPDIERIEPIQMINGQMELAFYQTGFEQPFFSSRMSDGTLKLFAYYLMLHENTPRQLIFIEEPENGLYHHYLADLAYEMKKSTGTGYNKQIFVTTHSPFFVNALSPEQVWVLEKGADGFTTAKRASEYPFVKDMAEEGVSMGDLWYSKYFG